MKFLNIKNFNSINKIQLICIFSLLGFAIYLSFIGGYGADEDTLPMIYVFESKLDSGNFVSSRFTGNPVEEIGIGFLAYFFGSWAANLTTFIFLIIGLLLFYYSFEKKDNKELLLFLLKNKLTDLSINFFALAVGVRLNYFLFIVITILFFNDTEIPLKKKLIIIFCIFFTGALFYVPVWYDSKLQLTWLTAGRSYDGYLDLLSRFSYKSFYAFGGISIFFVIYSFYKNYLKLIEDNNLFLFLFLLFSNLLIFLWLPAELSYLQLAIICVYLLIIRYSQKKLIYLILIFNFATWIINPEFLVIKYKQMESMCSPKQAIKADLKFSLDKGYYFKYMNTRKMINCFAPGDTERNKRIRQGLSIR